MRTKPITVALLRRKRACQPAIDKFECLFGNSVVPTRDLAIKHADNFRFGWAAHNLLTTAAWKVYHEAITTVENTCDEAAAHAGAAYVKATAEISGNGLVDYKGYCAAVAPFRKSLRAAEAIAFVDAWRGKSK
jgi:hypothetical protein